MYNVFLYIHYTGKNLIRKIFIIAILIVILFSIGSNCFALDLSSADLQCIGQADYHLKYYREERGVYTYVICSIVGYYNGSTFYPAYCMNKSNDGAESGAYTVSINSLIDNDAVWRVVKNGYPYKTAAEMGLTNDYDAYAVTKFAIYCVLGESNLDYYMAETDDATAVQMLSVLQNLVNIGLNGTETRSDGTMTVTPIGDLEIDRGCYYQEYQVTSSVNMSSFTVDICDFPESSYVGGLDNEPQTTFSIGETFKVFIPRESFNEDISGTITITGTCETYPVFYGEAPSSDLQNYVITYSSYGSESLTTNLQITTNTGALQILKLDEDTSEPIEEIEFTLTNEDGTYSLTQTTDENGEITFDNLYQGTYILAETGSSDTYVLSDENWYIDIVYNETTNLTIENSAKKGRIKIIKIDSETGSLLEGVTFNIVDSETDEIIETITTNEYGEAESSDLRIDKNYYLQEILAIDGYVLNDEKYYFNVEYDDTLEITIENEKIPEETEEETEETVEEVTEEIIEEEITEEEEKILPQTGF